MVSLQLSAQELSLSLSQHANKQAVIVAVHGVRKDTLGIILLDQNGKGSFDFKNKQVLAGLVNKLYFTKMQICLLLKCIFTY